MAKDRIERDLGPQSVTDAKQPARAFWRRIPKGWLLLAIYVSAWVAAYLIFQGIVLLVG